MASQHSLPPPSKRRKIQKDSAETIKRLENEIISAIGANSSLNSLVDILSLLFDLEDPHDTSKGIYALYRVFVSLILSGKLSPGGDEAAKVVKAWLWEKLMTYTDFLGGLLQDEEKFLRISALQIMFSLLKHLSTSLTQSSPSRKPQLHVTYFRRIVASLVLCPRSRRSTLNAEFKESRVDIDVLDSFHETWFSVYDDIRWFFLRESATLMNRHSTSEHSYLAVNLLAILERLTTFPTEANELNAWWVAEFGAKPPKPRNSKNGRKDAELSSEEDDLENGVEDDDWRKFFEDEKGVENGGNDKQPGIRLRKMTIHQSLHTLSSHQAVFTRAWLALLPRLYVGAEVEKARANATRVLNIMHRGVMPHFTRPILLMDWITSCVDLGGPLGLLALNALFILIKEQNLDYPSFYTRLYAFLDRDVLHLKHRARFFRLTELFLSSTHLPAALLASFVKKLSRLSLTAPPAAIVMVVPFVYNILKRHPALMVMIHRVDTDGACIDPFLACERDPMKTRALESSLWELLSHTSHYHAGVSTLCKVFSAAFTKPGYALEDFLDHTYHTLIETELHRKIKREPAMEIESGIKVFPEEVQGSEPTEAVGRTDVVGELWSFS